MNKKWILPIVVLSLLVVGVSAGLLTYYGQVEQHITTTQAVILDGGDCTDNICVENIADVYSPGTSISGLHTLTNRDPNNDRDVRLKRTGCTPNCGGITTTYVKPVALDDDNNWGAEEVVGIEVSGTLNDLFADEGLQYTYTILDGGNDNGASPAVAVVNLVDGRHIILFAGAGTRTGTHTLTFSETIASDTGGNQLVDFALQPNGFGAWIYGSGPTYGDFEFVKGDTTELDGAEQISRVWIMTQGANTQSEEVIESMLVNGVEYEFIAGNSGELFTVSSLNPKLGFMIKNDFVTTDGTYTITTEAQVEV